MFQNYYITFVICEYSKQPIYYAIPETPHKNSNEGLLRYIIVTGEVRKYQTSKVELESGVSDAILEFAKSQRMIDL